jgi:hypothetical protein
MRESGLVILKETTERRSDGLVPAEFIGSFRAMPEEDARVRMMFVVASKPADCATQESVAWG